MEESEIDGMYSVKFILSTIEFEKKKKKKNQYDGTTFIFLSVLGQSRRAPLLKGVTADLLCNNKTSIIFVTNDLIVTIHKVLYKHY